MVLVSGLETKRSKDYPPGWNGLVKTPPMGWRSWNAFGNRITDAIIREAIDSITAKNWTVDGKVISLADFGYDSVGIDEGWEGCGAGINGTQHDAKGNPTINSKFPDMDALVKYGHSKNLKMGWYQNGCACGEKVEKLINYEGDIRNLHDFGFDAVKLDGCGKQRNLTFYAELMKNTGKGYFIENCHWGRCTDSDDSSCPTTEWCPFNWYRTSGDINSGTMSWYKNLQTTTKFQDYNTPLSVPSCWAYPDMLEVGRVSGTVEWNRAHFGAWCIVSAPLILGLHMTEELLKPIIDIITNSEAVAVNQAWAGHPGMLVKTWNPPSNKKYVLALKCDSSDPTQTGWSYRKASSTVESAGLCLDATVPKQLEMKKCGGSSQQHFTYDAKSKNLKAPNGQCVDVNDWNGPVVWLYNCNGGTNQQLEFVSNGTFCDSCGDSKKKCIGTSNKSPGSNAAQLWTKKMPNKQRAILIINANADTNINATVDFAELNMTGTVSVRDIWQKKDIGRYTGQFKATVPSFDSGFYQLSPA